MRKRNTGRLGERNSAGSGGGGGRWGGGGRKEDVKEFKTEQIKSLLIFLYTFLFKRDVLTE